jgi:AraC family transcriptional regulator
MEPTFIIKPSFTVVGLRITTKPKSPEIPKLWDAFVPRMIELPNVSEPYVSYGVMQSMGDALDYMAGNPVNKIDNVPSGMQHWDIPEQTYAVFEATLPTIMEVFDSIYKSWLPASGYQHANSPVLERYGETFSPENPVLDIYIPITKKAKE